MVKEDLTMTKILTREAFENAIRTCAAIGGSTNAVIHLLAIAGRIGVDLKLADWDKLGAEMPCLVDLQPSGWRLVDRPGRDLRRDAVIAQAIGDKDHDIAGPGGHGKNSESDQKT